MKLHYNNITGVKMRNFLILMLLVTQSAVVFSSDFWVKVSNQANNDTIYCSLVDRNNNIFLGTKRHRLLKSSDDGKSWVEKKIGLDSTVLNRFWSIASDSLGNIYASVIPKGIYKSTDQGETWKQINSGIKVVNGSILCFDLACDKNNVVFASMMDDQVYRSTNFGVTWSEITSHSILNGISISSLTIDNYNSVYCSIMGNNKNIWGIFKTSDNGDTWHQILDSSYIKASGLVVNSLNNFFTNFFPFSLLRSLDSSKSFHKIFQLSDSNRISAYRINSRDHIYAVYQNKGLFFSIDNGDNWNYLDDDSVVNNFTNITFEQNGYIYASTWGKGLYRSKEPMPKFYVDSEFDPPISNTKLLTQGDTVEYRVKLTMKDSVYSIANANVSIINEINSDVIKSTTDSLGEIRYKFSVPMNRDTGEFKVRFYFSKFGYEKLDTIFDKVIIKKYVSVEEASINQPTAFSIIPNPASDQITIEIKNFEIGELQIELSDISGKVFIKKHDFITSHLSQQLTIKTTNLINGVYLISITQEDKKIFKKLIINK